MQVLLLPNFGTNQTSGFENRTKFAERTTHFIGWI
jgi:hypothetical protein